MSPHSISVPLILPSLALSLARACLCELVSVVIMLRCPCGREADWFCLQRDLLLLQSYMNSAVASPPSPKHYSYLWWERRTICLHCFTAISNALWNQPVYWTLSGLPAMFFCITKGSQKGNLRFLNLHFTSSRFHITLCICNQSLLRFVLTFMSVLPTWCYLKD